MCKPATYSSRARYRAWHSCAWPIDSAQEHPQEQEKRAGVEEILLAQK
jgi:hypothetical protein